MLFGYHHEAHSRDTDGHAIAFGVKEQVCPPRRSASPDEVIEGCCFVAVHESAVGTTRTFRNVRYSVAVGGKADIEQAASVIVLSARQGASLRQRRGRNKESLSANG